ncbi:MAG: glycosyltransferase [Acidimicrobiales bacterium]
MRVLAACSLGGAGHFKPLVPFLEAAQYRGDETLVVGPPAMSDLVTGSGFAFRPGAEPSETEIAPIREKFLVVSRAEALVLGNRELFGRLAASAMLACMEQTYRDWAPQLILREPCEYASVVARPTRPAVTAQVAISLAQAEAASIAAAGAVLEEYRKGLIDEVWASPYLTCFPESLDPSPFPNTVRFSHPRRALPRPLPAFWDSSDRPFVYASFGTVLGHMSVAAEVYKTVLAAVGGLDARVLLTVGRGFDPALLGSPPPNVHVERWVDQSDVLAQADLVVCHGGSGTVCGALAAGVPMVMVPRFADQFENARRVAQARAGLTVEPRTGSQPCIDEEHDSCRIKTAAQEVLSSPAFKRHAGRLASEMASYPTAEEVLGRLLEAALPH